VYDLSKRATVFKRYCHVYTEGELRELLQSVPGCQIRDEYYDTGNWCAVVVKDAGTPSSVWRKRLDAVVGGGPAPPQSRPEKAVPESDWGPSPGGSSVRAGVDGARTASGYAIASGCAMLHPQPGGAGVSTGPCAPARAADTPAACAAEAVAALDGRVDAAVLAHVQGMLEQVQAIAGAADDTQREAQYDALAQMLERARLGGAR
jgi:hypothetical protein